MRIVPIAKEKLKEMLAICMLYYWIDVSYDYYKTMNRKIILQLAAGDLTIIFDLDTKLVDLVTRRECLILAEFILHTYLFIPSLEKECIKSKTKCTRTIK